MSGTTHDATDQWTDRYTHAVMNTFGTPQTVLGGFVDNGDGSYDLTYNLTTRG